MDSRDFVYRVDRDDRISYVDDAWREFARENDAPDLPDRVLGQSLYHFIAGIGVRQIYSDLLKRVRTRGRPISIPFRCDAPDLRRDMQLEIFRLPGDDIEFRSTILAERPLARGVLLDPTRSRTIPFVPMCSWCKQAQVENVWYDIEAVLDALHLFDDDVMPEITHTVCPTCEALLLADIA